MGKYSGKTSPAEFVAGWLYRRGIDVDPQRLEDRVAAERSRANVDTAQSVDSVRTKAGQLKRARKACELEEWAWRRNPSGDSLQRAMAAQRGRQAAEDELLEACCYDRELYRAVLRQA